CSCRRRPEVKLFQRRARAYRRSGLTTVSSAPYRWGKERRGAEGSNAHRHTSVPYADDTPSLKGGPHEKRFPLPECAGRVPDARDVHVGGCRSGEPYRGARKAWPGTLQNIVLTGGAEAVRA